MTWCVRRAEVGAQLQQLAGHAAFSSEVREQPGVDRSQDADVHVVPVIERGA